MDNFIEALGIFLFYDLVFLACLILAVILEHIQERQARKRARAIRQAKVRQAQIEYLKMIS